MLADRESYGAYITYSALKRHFDDEAYDFHKYHGKIRGMKYETFETRNDTGFYYRISRKKDMLNFLLANLIVNPKSWIRDLCGDSADKIYTEWKKKQDSLTYMYTSDLSKLKDDFKENFREINGNHPYIITLVLRNEISFETFAILCSIANVIDKWKASLSDKIIARKLVVKAEKYLPFLNIDTKKFTEITEKKFF